MTDIRSYININPLDLETNRAIGVSLPFNGEGVFNSTYTSKDQIKTNILSVILTEQGERIFRPNFGVGLRRYLFENFTDVTELEEKIRFQVERHVPQVELNRVNITKDPNSHELKVAIFYIIKANNSMDAIQLNFASDNILTNSSMNSPSIGNY
jgi:phage baseplate assembly protein W